MTRTTCTVGETWIKNIFKKNSSSISAQSCSDIRKDCTFLRIHGHCSVMRPGHHQVPTFTTKQFTMEGSGIKSFLQLLFLDLEQLGIIF